MAGIFPAPRTTLVEVSEIEEKKELGLRDRGLQLVLLVVLCLQLISWGLVEGYQLGDSVEYMERAQALVRGEEVIDSTAIRSFGFVSLIAPFFALADLLGIEDFKPIVALVRLFQILLGLELARVCARLGARLAGREVGLVAALAVGLNPYFLQYSVSPVTGIVAGVCVGHALLRLVERRGARNALVGGLWLGGALLMAYKTSLVVAPIFLYLALRDRLKHWRHTAAVAGGFGIGIFAAAALDRLCYGEWGKSLDLYFRQNFGQLAARYTGKLGLEGLATRLYRWAYVQGDAPIADLTHDPGALVDVDQPWFYITRLPEMVVWPLLVLAVLGLFWTVRRRDARSGLLAFVLLANLVLMGVKNLGSFRLLLPLLPCIAPLVALGWRVVVGDPETRRTFVRPAVGALTLVAAGGFAWAGLRELNTAKYSGFWRAMTLTDSIAAEVGAGEEGVPKLRAASSWNWAVFMRESSRVELIKLPHHLDLWATYDEEEHREDLEAIAELDVFITHLAVLLNFPEVFAAVNEHFEVTALLYDPLVFENTGPILVMRERSGEPGARTFLDRSEGVGVEEYLGRRDVQPGRRFQRPGSAAGEHHVTLLGWSFQTLPGDGHGWLTWHWICEASHENPFVEQTRLTTAEVEQPWVVQHRIGRKLLPSTAWQPGWIVSEGWPVVAAVAPFAWQKPWRPLRGKTPAEEPVPAQLWLRLVPVEEDGRHGAPLWPLVAETGQPIRPADLDSNGLAPDGSRLAPGGFISLGTVELSEPADPATTRYR